MLTARVAELYCMEAQNHEPFLRKVYGLLIFIILNLFLYNVDPINVFEFGARFSPKLRRKTLYLGLGYTAMGLTAMQFSGSESKWLRKGQRACLRSIICVAITSENSQFVCFLG